MFEYSPAWPHHAIEAAFPDIFFVRGTNRTRHEGVDIQTSRSFMDKGLIGAANIPSTWRQACAPDAEDVRRLLSLPFRHLITAHGAPLRHVAHSLLQTRVDAVLPVNSPSPTPVTPE